MYCQKKTLFPSYITLSEQVLTDLRVNARKQQVNKNHNIKPSNGAHWITDKHKFSQTCHQAWTTLMEHSLDIWHIY